MQAKDNYNMVCKGRTKEKETATPPSTVRRDGAPGMGISVPIVAVHSELYRLTPAMPFEKKRG